MSKTEATFSETIYWHEYFALVRCRTLMFSLIETRIIYPLTDFSSAEIQCFASDFASFADSESTKSWNVSYESENSPRSVLYVA